MAAEEITPPDEEFLAEVAPRAALKVTDEAVQMFGGQGISQDTPLARARLMRCTAARSPETSCGNTRRKI